MRWLYLYLALGMAWASGSWFGLVNQASPEFFAMSLGMVPLAGVMMGGNGSGATATVPDFAQTIQAAIGSGGGGGVLPPSYDHGTPDPEWLMWVKGSFDVFMKVALFFFHWILMSGALPFGDAYFGDAPAVGPFLDAIGLGNLTLAALMSWILSVVAILIPVCLWYMAFTTNVLGNFKGFWQSSPVNRILFVSVMLTYVGILSMEWTILYGRIEQLSTAASSALPSFIERPNPLVMVVLSFLVSLITFVLGALTAKLIIALERKYQI